ncbi:MAG: hypothetical protein JJ979_09790, partial [Roseibium sp.]|nr:hypothetical protein [Roseibium sp.]
IEPKLDGVRTICVIEKGKVGFYSRTGKEFPALDHLTQPVLQFTYEIRQFLENETPPVSEAWRTKWREWLGGSITNTSRVVLDGEVVSGQFNKTVGDVRRGSEAATDAEFHVFDILPLHLFSDIERKIDIPYCARRDLLTNFFRPVESAGSPIQVNTNLLVNSVEEIHEHYANWRAQGLEGAIVKPLDDIYTKKRTAAWLKLKNQESVDVPITGAFEGTGKNEGKLGGLYVDVDGVETRVGGGFTDEQRETIWADWLHDSGNSGSPVQQSDVRLVGRLIEVEYHEKTPDGSLRHPRFVGWRDDKDDGSHLENAA